MSINTYKTIKMNYTSISTRRYPGRRIHIIEGVTKPELKEGDRIFGFPVTIPSNPMNNIYLDVGEYEYEGHTLVLGKRIMLSDFSEDRMVLLPRDLIHLQGPYLFLGEQ